MNGHYSVCYFFQSAGSVCHPYWPGGDTPLPRVTTVLHLSIIPRASQDDSDGHAAEKGTSSLDADHNMYILSHCMEVTMLVVGLLPELTLVVAISQDNYSASVIDVVRQYC